MKIIFHLVIFPIALSAENIAHAVVKLLIGISYKQNICQVVFWRKKAISSDWKRMESRPEEPFNYGFFFNNADILKMYCGQFNLRDLESAWSWKIAELESNPSLKRCHKFDSLSGFFSAARRNAILIDYGRLPEYTACVLKPITVQLLPAAAQNC